ncbi:MAG TPA: metallopeptidase family protein [Phycisphaerales bacterium]|nr:metallopeptidase family protein [Phycisphaerales bacterium]
MDQQARDRFDGLLEEALEQLPPRIKSLLDEVPLVVEDVPSDKLTDELIAELGLHEGETRDEFRDGLCGLHSGVSITERSTDQPPEMPEEIRIFRSGIVSLAGGWDQDDADDWVYEEIMVTLLHEIGHHFGLDEEQLTELGYD